MVMSNTNSFCFNVEQPSRPVPMQLQQAHKHQYDQQQRYATDGWL